MEEAEVIRDLNGMKWRKCGVVYAPTGQLWWARSHAMLPTAEVIDDRAIRVYFASLDANRYGRIGYVDLDVDNPRRVLYETREPALDIGELGAFDDSGVNPSCVINVDGRKYLYYIGWQRCVRVPYMLFAGLAVSEDGVRFKKSNRVPMLDRTSSEPFLRSAISVVHEQGVFRGWYVSGLGWITIGSTQYPTYTIRYAESADGIRWKAYEHACINSEEGGEFGFGRPWVIREEDVYKMWYSIRSRTSDNKVGYKIGYAESEDGLRWIRKDEEVGIAASQTGWDSEMICFPCVVDVKGRRHMFYNGNRHGSTGFGFAVLES